MRILFVTSTRIGDAVLSTGLLDHLLRAYPEARFTIACGPVAEGVFARMPRREETIVLAKRSLSLHWLELWRRVAGRRWDLVVDLRGSALAWTLRAGTRAVMRGGRRPGHRLGHIAETLDLDPPPMPVAWTAPEDEARAAALLGAGPGAIAGQVPILAPILAPILTLGPTANWSGKIWPWERFEALARRLTAPDGLLPGARIVVLGGPGETERAIAAPLLEALRNHPGGVTDLLGQLSLPEAAAVLRRAALFVGNDSGLMHLSAAAGTPTLGLFGPTPADEYAPAGRAARAVIAADGRMEGLSVAQVAEAAGRLLPARLAA
ncbi:ADP-heptose--LPS heptosyltransferase [Roseomonas mucosa]|uniref:Lipopolysaccharide core heptosyltransferase rfaQ n=2 Tax=Roseomonadaceae TaxID=3385906 RepID=A0A379N4X7_9PROT|nr:MULTISPECIES: glycosyltransferase family 9 protein [Roseomonas]MBS5901456.1 glycosyltransferase family 9 protein [Acetobacteraceae bacterium]AWV23757.1 ADP-heptose--LPS heptosyltransferase [Roseomonas mucosa]MCG7353356.1 glycosyltransferase family 9 protein [Roseomonas mucosa]MCG7357768.1 glycosyltransferase family 9 protein [Roseomonas mucosa]MDT8276348.1 glycosyltransferase family 9 protein [Roseomonas mucosa]